MKNRPKAKTSFGVPLERNKRKATVALSLENPMKEVFFQFKEEALKAGDLDSG